MNSARRPLRRTDSHPLIALVLALLTLSSGLVAMTMATGLPASGASASASSLSVSPSTYVGGQRLLWRGNIGVRGERPLELQFNMGAAVGGVWDTVEGFSARTRADGSFSFAHPAPSMFNIRYRVKSGAYVTPARTFNAKTQDLTIRVTGQKVNDTHQPGRVDEGESFGITVDTTPDNIYRSPESQDLPVLRGRVLTLQKRIDGRTWRTLDTTQVGADGLGQFAGLTAQAGVVVYRVRQEDYLKGGDRIGWTQSFPLYVLVGRDAQRWFGDRYGSARTSPLSLTTPRGASLGPQPTTASQRFMWFPSVFDFAWEHGQSLSSPPARGTRIQGRWSDFSNGGGRVQKYNGGLAIDSKRYTGAGPGDFGTTRATLQGNAMTQGRWELSMRIRNAYERGGRAYRVLAELVPANPADYDCGRHNVMIASISPFERQVRFGVRSPQHTWTGSANAAYTPLTNAYNVAVEVGRSHLTWFLNGAPVGSVSSSAAVPGVPMTLRLSMEGRKRAEMDQTGLISDWQRGFPISTGRQTVSPKQLARHEAGAAGCKGSR